MDWGGPEFVLCIIGMAMFAGVLKSWGRAAHGVDKKGKRRVDPADQAELGTLRAENARLRERLDLHEDRLITLEKIVTDGGYDLARQIERLRDPAPAPRLDVERELRRN